MRPMIVLASVLCLVTALPAVAPARMFRNPCCCQTCLQPCGGCTCGHAPPLQMQTQAVPQTSYQPVVDTQYVQQPVTTYRDVVETQYRTEAVNETVPSVSYENVTRDEGGYQTVWVPRPVTRQMARTTYQTRTSYRQVPYQVTRRVAEQGMQTVPTQSMRYVPTTTMNNCNSCVPAYGAMSSGVPYTSAVLPYVQSAQVNSGLAPSPVVSSLPTMYSGVPTAVSSSALQPTPDPRYASSYGAPTPVTPVLPRTASTDLGYSDREGSSSATAPRTASAPLFVPAPSAALVWQSQRNTITR